MMQFVYQVIKRLISQLIKDISKVLQKLVKYFNGTAIFAFIMPSLLEFSKNFHLNFKNSDSVITLFGSSLRNLCKLPDVFA